MLWQVSNNIRDDNTKSVVTEVLLYGQGLLVFSF